MPDRWRPDELSQQDVDELRDAAAAQLEARRREDNLYDVARRVTDEVLGPGTYAEINAHNPDPGIQAAILRYKGEAAALTDDERRDIDGGAWDGP